MFTTADQIRFDIVSYRCLLCCMKALVNKRLTSKYRYLLFLSFLFLSLQNLSFEEWNGL